MNNEQFAAVMRAKADQAWEETKARLLPKFSDEAFQDRLEARLRALAASGDEVDWAVAKMASSTAVKLAELAFEVACARAAERGEPA